MSFKLFKRIAVAFLVACYCFGQMIIPTNADSGDSSLFDELLAEREAGENAESESTAEPEETMIEIGDFSDVKKEDWFYPYLEYLVSKGMIKGKTPDSFEPNSSFSYAECSAVIVRYLGLEEEAVKRMYRIAERMPDMKNVWYAGYFEVMATLGLFEEYGLYEMHDGLITYINTDEANSPVVRYRFAESISESFELDSSMKAKNVYGEIGGSGREFILGGGYNRDVLSLYEAKISDYAEIPQHSRENVLKAYYNGIFNGDISGSFYPHNNLTRAEMAKVLATVSDFSLRTRLINEGYGQKVNDDMLHTDAFGVKTLDCDYWQKLLMLEAENLHVDDGNISYTSSHLFPEGYAVDVYLYEQEDDGYKLRRECTLHDGNDGGFTYEADNARVLFVMRNVKENSRPEGVVDIAVSDGSAVSIKPRIREE